MLMSETSQINGARQLQPIGRIRAASRWFSALDAPQEAEERKLALERLRVEAMDYEADGLIEVALVRDQISSCDLASRTLQRITATAVAVRFATA